MNYQLIIKVLPWIFLFVIGTLFGERITRFFNITKDENVDWIFGILFIANIFYLIYKSFKPRISYDNLSVDDKRIINSLGIYTPILFLIIYYFFFRQDLIPFSFTNALYYFDVVIISFAVINFSYTRYLDDTSKHDIKDELNRNIVVEQIKAEILNNSKSKYSSYNIAITGEWGIGKTFIKNELIKKLNDDVETPMRIIDFHPWSTRKSIDIDEQFVQQLSSQVKDLEIKYSLGRYFDQFFNVNNSFIANAFKSIKEIFLPPITKQELGNIIQSNQAIVTFIDDIDRLEKEEIIELFKFIRNNGDIPHLIYVLIYDVDHLTKVLDLKDYHHYIAKFIDIEIDLYRGKLDYIKVFEDNLISKLESEQEKTAIKAVLFTLDSANDEYFKELFSTIRNIKLFSKKVLFQINLKRDLIKENRVNVHDLFVLEIIKYKFSDLFKILFNKEYNKETTDILLNYLLKNDSLDTLNAIVGILNKLINENLKYKPKIIFNSNVNSKKVLYDNTIPSKNESSILLSKNHMSYFNDFHIYLDNNIIEKALKNHLDFTRFLKDYRFEIIILFNEDKLHQKCNNIYIFCFNILNKYDNIHLFNESIISYLRSDQDLLKRFFEEINIVNSFDNLEHRLLFIYILIKSKNLKEFNIDPFLFRKIANIENEYEKYNNDNIFKYMLIYIFHYLNQDINETDKSFEFAKKQEYLSSYVKEILRLEYNIVFELSMHLIEPKNTNTTISKDERITEWKLSETKVDALMKIDTFERELLSETGRYDGKGNNSGSLKRVYGLIKSNYVSDRKNKYYFIDLSDDEIQNFNEIYNARAGSTNWDPFLIKNID